MKPNFKGKRVTLVGLGQYENGSGISAARFLLEEGARLTVTDLKKPEQLGNSYETLEKLYKSLKKKGYVVHPVKYVWGEHRDSDFIATDWILRNPSVPNHSKYLEMAREAGITIDTDISLFMRLCPAKVIGITGTRGKSTTTALIYEMLKANLARSKTKVYLGGNILFSPLNFVRKVKVNDWVVLELSSWQTESLTPFKISPHISVITNLYPDHMNTYSGMAEYGAAKEAVFNFQRADDFAVVNADNSYTREIGKRAKGSVIWFGLKRGSGNGHVSLKEDEVWLTPRSGEPVRLASLKKMKLVGEHNKSNILAASGAAYLAGAKTSAIQKVIKIFPGLPNRLELVAEKGGVKFYNDTTATTAEGTIAALKSFPAKKIILIAGGSEKNLPFDELAKEIIYRAKDLVLLNDKASERVAKEVTGREKDFPLYWAQNMDEAVQSSIALAKKGDIILMSPACASFGLFKNEFDRAAKFIAAVKKNIRKIK